MLHNLAGFLNSKGDYIAAESICRKVLAIREKVLGPDHPYTATSFGYLARILQAKEDYEGAERLFRRTLLILEKALGADHSYTATSLSDLAKILELTGDHGAAVPLYRRALAITEKVLGPDHPSTATSLNNLAALLRKTGKLDEARGLELKYMDIVSHRANVMPLELRQAALGAYNLGEFSLAEKLLIRMLDAGFEVSGTHCHLARICLITDNIDEARHHANSAWMHRGDAPPYVTPRIFWFQIAIDLLDGTDPAPHLGHLKIALSTDGAFMEWAMDPVLAHLKPKLSDDALALLTALVAALSDSANLPALDRFPQWREAKALPLEGV
jgi:hypothetical protein